MITTSNLTPNQLQNDSESEVLLVKTPMTTKGVRRLQQEWQRNPTPGKLSLLFRSQEALAAQHELDLHVKRGLFETIKEEKRRRQRGKRLNLVGEEGMGAQLFSAEVVCKAKDFASEKETREALEKDEKVKRKEELKAKKKAGSN